jgi:phospholipid N-methyltransferase
MFNDKNFYPTPSELITKMCFKVKNKNPLAILEPSAGKGDIVKHLEHSHIFGYGKKTIKAIELNDDLFATLKGKDISVIDRDFLNYNGGDIFDLIIMLAPSSNVVF